MIEHHAAMARKLGEELELPAEVIESLGSSYEFWDGRGWPGKLKGEQVPLPSRMAQLAEFVEVAHRVGGVQSAREVALRNAGKQFDPALAELFAREAESVLGGLEEISSWEAVIEADPAIGAVLSGERFDGALTAIANFVDLKSPYTLGHTTAVAALVEAAGERLGLPEDERLTLRRAGLAHDLGRLGVSNSIWDKPGPLGAGEWERVRLAPPLHRAHAAPVRGARGRWARSPSSTASASTARATRAGSPAARSPRPPGCSRPPTPTRRCANRARTVPRWRPRRRRASCAANVEAGRLDAEAVEAVLGAAGHRVPVRRRGPAGLTQREIEVLRLIARGLSNKSIAAQLVISPKTVANHVEHIYAKIGVSTRAAASLFAMQQGLLPEEAFPAGKMGRTPHAPPRPQA